jgi:hypothetical protein
MATSQTRLGQYGRYEYGRGDLLKDTGTGRAVKLTLTECPLCAVDPSRPQHHFGRHASVAHHIRTKHTPSDALPTR